MGAHSAHGHAHSQSRIAVSDRRAIRIVIAVIIPVIIGTIAAMAALWPNRDKLPDSIPITDPSAVIMYATITTAGNSTTTDVGAVITKIPASSAKQLQEAGEQVPAVGTEMRLYMSYEQLNVGVEPGSKARIVYLPYAVGVDDGSGNEASPYVFLDYDRSAPIGVLAVIYALLVLVVARWRGLAAFIGLGLSMAVLAYFTLPALLAGGPPLPIALVSSVAIMLVSLYVAHGVSVRTSAALLGTVVGLALTTGIAWWATKNAQLTGMTSDEALSLPSYVPGLDLRGLVMCGIVLAGLGVLNDVTVTQASAVWEMRELAPHATRWQLFRGALRIGRDHIASTVYTIVFAYLGASLPLFMLVVLQEQSIATSITSGSIAEEVVRTLVSSIGLVLAIPITTVLATILAPGHQSSAPPREPSSDAPGDEPSLPSPAAGSELGDEPAPGAFDVPGWRR
ncbi:YibE/F family protein [Rarobacter incanus]|uniref:YibE/F-like protein n=1 Tax=Rarobacter incanus TaxID=153494 RepID=A0A542SQR6_9MICO|nr:YibE/F family protein [Rarobacter incanus]TQK76959.1 YibE/F-like protein [Rarobacter incanus]